MSMCGLDDQFSRCPLRIDWNFAIRKDNRNTMLVFNLSIWMGEGDSIESKWIEIIPLKCIFQLSRAGIVHINEPWFRRHTTAGAVEGTGWKLCGNWEERSCHENLEHSIIHMQYVCVCWARIVVDQFECWSKYLPVRSGEASVRWPQQWPQNARIHCPISDCLAHNNN